MGSAPFINYLSKRFNFKVPLVIGAVVLILAQIFAGLSTHIWQLFLTQGIMFGFGLGFVSLQLPYRNGSSFSSYVQLWIPALPLTNQWFSKKRALAGVSPIVPYVPSLCSVSRLYISRVCLRQVCE